MEKLKFRVWLEEIKTMQYSDILSSFFNDHAGYNRPIMQYTGLKDKNGKEIYEGDIIIADWGYGASRPIKVILKEILYNSVECTISDEAEVIGNIYQNLDMLTD